MRIPFVVRLLQRATLLGREDARIRVSPDGGQEDVLARQLLVLGSSDRISAATSLFEHICINMLPLSAYPVGMNVQAKRVRKARQPVCALCRGPILTLGCCHIGCVTGQHPEAA